MSHNIGKKYPRGFTLLFAGAWLAGSIRPAQGQTSSSSPSTTPPFIAGNAQQMPSYEVATIKPWDGKGFAVPLRVYIQLAFGIPPNRTGSVIGPGWIDSLRYVIQAKPPDSVRDAMRTMPAADGVKVIEQMRQSLLAERFQLKAHFETREMPEYQLVLAKGGSKLKEAVDPAKGSIMPGRSAFSGKAVSMDSLISTLESAPDIGGRPVINKTGLSGHYDIALKWTPMDATTPPSSGSGAAPSSDAEGASLFTAIQEQLGLKLVSARGPIQVLVIDHIERPTGN